MNYRPEHICPVLDYEALMNLTKYYARTDKQSLRKRHIHLVKASHLLKIGLEQQHHLSCDTEEIL